jgi:hypothetical protein
MKHKIRIGCGAGFSGDRLEPSLTLIEKGELDYLVLECLAERTIALAQKRKLHDPSQGYDPLLERRIDLLLEALVSHDVCLITNMGAANPIAAAEKIIHIARSKNLEITVAAVTGDDVLNEIDQNTDALETGKPLAASGKIISANAYLGVDGILGALKNKPRIIITGRVADPSLFLAPMVHEFGWPLDDYNLLGKGTVIGHLMECAGQITGGYFADPGKKDVPGMENLGHPFVDVFPDGAGTISKVKDTGGVVNLQTAKEQLLYEVVNPHAYYTPDVVADFSTVSLKEVDTNIIRVSGGSGTQRPATFKVSVGYQAFYLGEGEISYAGPNALGRAKLAGEIVKQRLSTLRHECKIDLLGYSAIHGQQFNRDIEPYEVRLRVVAKAMSQGEAARIGEEVEALYTNGPAGGGGVRKYVNDVIGIVSTLIDRLRISHTVTIKST